MRLIDLFAGIGGIRLGFHLAAQQMSLETECVFSSEWDKFTQETYEKNFGEKPHGDITQINANDVPDHDIICAGFPCQAFSHAGKKLGFEDTRGTLFFDVARIIENKKPKVIFLENVVGLKNHDGGNTFKVILDTLNNLGYHVKYEILSGKDFGVPQNRRRIYIVGFLDQDVYNNFAFPKPLEIQTVVGDILDENIDEKYRISKRLWTSHKARKERNKQNGKGFGYQLVTKDSNYTATLSARYYKDGSEILVKIPHKHTPRRLTPRECARLQGFPESFLIPVSDTQAYKQFGNSVCVPVIKQIAVKIFEAIGGGGE